MPVCKQCGEDKPEGAFNKAQLKKKADKRRCKSCVEQDVAPSPTAPSDDAGLAETAEGAAPPGKACPRLLRLLEEWDAAWLWLFARPLHQFDLGRVGLVCRLLNKSIFPRAEREAACAQLRQCCASFLSKPRLARAANAIDSHIRGAAPADAFARAMLPIIGEDARGQRRDASSRQQLVDAMLMAAPLARGPAVAFYAAVESWRAAQRQAVPWLPLSGLGLGCHHFAAALAGRDVEVQDAAIEQLIEAWNEVDEEYTDGVEVASAGDLFIVGVGAFEESGLESLLRKMLSAGVVGHLLAIVARVHTERIGPFHRCEAMDGATILCHNLIVAHGGRVLEREERAAEAWLRGLGRGVRRGDPVITEAPSLLGRMAQMIELYNEHLHKCRGRPREGANAALPPEEAAAWRRGLEGLRPWLLARCATPWFPRFLAFLYTVCHAEWWIAGRAFFGERDSRSFSLHLAEECYARGPRAFFRWLHLEPRVAIGTLLDGYARRLHVMPAAFETLKQFECESAACGSGGFTSGGFSRMEPSWEYGMGGAVPDDEFDYSHMD